MEQDVKLLKEEISSPTKIVTKADGERGAAMVTALLITSLLLSFCGALVMMTSTSVVNTFDAASEMQAYYAAEAGLQASLDVLRGNVAPTDSTLSTSGTKITFRNAVTPLKSNKSGDPATTGFSLPSSLPCSAQTGTTCNPYARLSGWLDYDTTFTDRVILTSGYTKMNGSAYSVVVTNADSTATDSTSEPKQVLVQVTGYGPKNAVKKMEMLVSKIFTASYTSPGTVTIIGSPTATATISTGQSNAETYNGQDQAKPTATPLPAIAVTTSSDLTAARNAVNTANATVSPTPQQLSNSSLPSFVQSADAARATLNDLQELSQSMSRYYTPSSPPTDCGTPAVTGVSTGFPKLTFVDGDLTVSNSYCKGAGLLVVTGTLTLDGNYSFQGLVLVLGTGRILRTGGGNGTIEGSILVASFDRYTTGAPFLAPTFNTSGGGNSTLVYNSEYVNNAYGSTVRRPLGIVEK